MRKVTNKSDNISYKENKNILEEEGQKKISENKQKNKTPKFVCTKPKNICKKKSINKKNFDGNFCGKKTTGHKKKRKRNKCQLKEVDSQKKDASESILDEDDKYQTINEVLRNINNTHPSKYMDSNVNEKDKDQTSLNLQNIEINNPSTSMVGGDNSESDNISQNRNETINLEGENLLSSEQYLFFNLDSK